MEKANKKRREPLFYIEGIPIHKSNPVMLRFHHVAYAKLVRLMIASDLSMATMLRLMLSPCQRCGHNKVEIPLQPQSSHVQKARRLPDFHKNTDIDDGQAADHDPLT